MNPAVLLIAGSAAVLLLARLGRRHGHVPAFLGTAEDFATAEPADSCDPVQKPGVVAFRNFVLGRFGGADLGIVRDCDLGDPSHHHEGRAWDWGVSASVPADRERVAALRTFLSRNNWEAFRRAGLRYTIWDGFVEVPPGEPEPATEDPHEGHVHFSFSTAGAAAETSFYRWLEAGLPTRRS